MNAIKSILLYLAGVNLTGFAIMGIDKWKAKKQAFRIPEATLFLIALIGGSIGSIIGMYTFRHKTIKLKFVIGMPVILVLQLLILLLLYTSSVQFVFL